MVCTPFPKCYKSILSLHLAVSVASGVLCLRRFQPVRTGPVLLFAAEDALHVVRQRLGAIACAHDVAFDALDIHVIVESSLRLDLDADRRALRETVKSLHPTLLVLDPFVRLHRSIDENSSADVAPILAYLRQLQRRFNTAVLLVHHARKGASSMRAGQALRGSSEFHAWGDSNLYLRRKANALLLTIEHRAAPSVDNLALEFHADDSSLVLHVADNDGHCRDDLVAPPPSVYERIEQVLATAAAPLSRQDLRATCHVRMSTLCDALTTLTRSGRIHKSETGYQLAVP